MRAKAEKIRHTSQLHASAWDPLFCHPQTNVLARCSPHQMFNLEVLVLLEGQMHSSVLEEGENVGPGLAGTRLSSFSRSRDATWDEMVEKAFGCNFRKSAYSVASRAHVHHIERCLDASLSSAGLTGRECHHPSERSGAPSVRASLPPICAVRWSDVERRPPRVPSSGRLLLDGSRPVRSLATVSGVSP